MIKQILLAGGKGKRVESLLNIPKQFCKLINKNNRKYSTFMLSLERAKSISDIKDIIIVINYKYIEIAIRQIMEISPYEYKKFTIVVEKNTCDTMIAIYQITKFVTQQYLNEENILVVPCDHIIFNIQNYINTVINSMKKHTNISLFGITPDNFAESIKFGNIFTDENSNILGFHEKPDITFLRKSLSHTIKHYWNSGIFLLNIEFILRKMSEIFNIKHDILLTNNKKSEKIDFPIEKMFFLNNNVEDLLKIPFDFLIPKVLENIKVAECSFDWIDIGSPEKIRELVN
jgi:mannose-1-phosphate guanylyltransferase